jgi:hypothetical protein
MLYFRRAVPEDARQAFEGRKEVWTSLKTDSVSVARSRLQRKLDDFETRLASVRGELPPVVIANEPYKPSKREIEIRVRAAFKDRIERVNAVNRLKPEAVAAAVQQLEELKRFRRALKRTTGIHGLNAPLGVQWHSEALCEKRCCQTKCTS